MLILTGARVALRPLTDADAEDFAALNGDAQVMRHFPKPLDRAESEAFRARIARMFEDQGFGFWGVFPRAGGALLGMVGRNAVPFAARFAPNVEISWRIARAQQRRGYAEEAARLCLDAAFGPLGLPEVVAWTLPANEASWRLMEKLGMRPGRAVRGAAARPGPPDALAAAVPPARRGVARVRGAQKGSARSPRRSCAKAACDRSRPVTRSASASSHPANQALPQSPVLAIGFSSTEAPSVKAFRPAA